MTDPVVKAMGAELVEACTRRANDLAASYAREHDVHPHGDEKDWLDIGIAAGAAATMQELVERGVIDSDRAI